MVSLRHCPDPHVGVQDDGTGWEDGRVPESGQQEQEVERVMVMAMETGA